MGIMSGITMPAPPPIKLEPGDIVSVISDGFFEYRDSNGNEFGTERVNEIIAANSSRTMEELIKILIAAIEKFAPDKPQDDDMTAVLFCRRR
jgi:sigma-B regulation protein RsbU (phosphoserine phosphatase)